MTKIRVGIVRGGVSDEYDVSLKTGASVLKHIPIERYEPLDIFIDKEGVWHANGFRTDLNKLAKHIDVAFNALHGKYGEDGGLQRDLSLFDIPYTGSESLSSAMGMNKALAKKRFADAGIKTPIWMIVRKGEEVQKAASEVFRKLPGSYVVKPISSGSSVGVSITNSYDGLVNAIENALLYSDGVLVEEYIPGRELTCAVIDGIDMKTTYALDPVEIIVPGESPFFDYNAKYGGKTQEVCPANLFDDTKERVQSAAVKAHHALGMRHYSRSDFILSPRGLYILEINSLPGLTEESLLPRSLKAKNIELPDFIDHVLTLALTRK